MSTADAIATYIEYKRCLGQRFTAGGAILIAFGKSVGDRALCDIRHAMIARFLDRNGASEETVHKKRCVLAAFFRFTVTRRLLATSPMPTSCTHKRGASSYTPYIYSEAELKRLLAAIPAAAGPHADIDTDTLRTFVLLLYGAALRRGEAMRLKIEDVDVSQSLIHVRGTKFFKTRIVPLSGSLNTVIAAFIARRRHQHLEGSPLFSKRDGRDLTDSALGAAFCRLRTIAGVQRDGGARNQPRMHDLRHSAAVHRVTAWYREGADLNDLLPKLATYLGHKDLSGTQRYLTMTQELLGEASRRFQAFAQGARHD
jgi:site-specific recombinase XerD